MHAYQDGCLLINKLWKESIQKGFVYEKYLLSVNTSDNDAYPGFLQRPEK
jgi:hypothetical protein